MFLKINLKELILKKILKIIKNSLFVGAVITIIIGSFLKIYSIKNEVKDETLINEIKKADSLVNFYESTLNKNLRLKQHFYAVVYKDSIPNDKNIFNFLKLSEFNKIENEAYITARLETANGKTGIGDSPYFNHFGMKLATTRFSWSIGLGKTGYVKYEGWPFSYLDFYEYKIKGYKNWQKTAKNKKIKIKNNKISVN